MNKIFVKKEDHIKHPVLVALYFVLLYLSSLTSLAQHIYPVQATVQLVPPYSVYLPDYAAPGNEKLRVILLQKDLTQADYQLKLYLSVSLNGKVIMRTSPSYNPGPIHLSAGVPTILSGADVAPYLDSKNLDFVGYSREQYEKTHMLPEGSFQICITGYDYTRQEVQVTNIGCSFYYLAKNEPPLINLPACGSKIPFRDPQQMIFSWTPRNTASPNSAATTEYEFNLYEIRIPGRNPNDIVMNTPPVYTVTTDMNILMYGPGEPPLQENLQYVWRVQAKDKEGRDMFRNNGFSEVCTFTYGGPDPNYVIGVVKDFTAEVKTERKVRLFWTPDPTSFDSYKVFYKKIGDDRDWFYQETKEGEIKINDLEPETQYEARIQGKKKGFYGEYSEIIPFTTPKKRVIQCGQEETLPVFTPGPPLLVATKGMTIHARGMEVILTDVTTLGGGWFKGKGMLPIYYLGGASFNCAFERIYIDENLNVTAGRIDLLSKTIDKMAEDQLVNQEDRKKEKLQKGNRDKYENEGVEFYENVFIYDQIAIKEITVGPTGSITITDVNGKTHPATNIELARAKDPEKAIILEDKNGDQVVIKKDGTVEKVPGGGLKGGGAGGVPVGEEYVNIIKKTLKEIRKEYGAETIRSLKERALETEKQFDNQNSYLSTTSAPTSEPVQDFEEITIITTETTSISGEEDKYASAYIKSQKELMSAKVLFLFSEESLKSKEFDLLVSEVKVNEKPLLEFIESERNAGVKDEEIISKAKDAVVEHIKGMVYELYKRK